MQTRYMYTTLKFVSLQIFHAVSELDACVRECINLVRAHQSLQSDKEGLHSLPDIGSKVEQYSKELIHAISSTTDR